MRRLITSERSSLRLDAARDFLATLPPDGDVLVLGASFEAAAELVRSLRRPIFGWQRATLFRCAAELARPHLLEEGLALATPLALEALWARVVYDLELAGKLGRLAPLSGRPGLSRALSATVAELRALEVPAAKVEPALQAAMEAFSEALARAKIVDRAELLRRAIAACEHAVVGPLALLDVVPAPGLETRFLEALVSRAPAVLAVLPGADAVGTQRLAAVLRADVAHRAPPADALAPLQQNLFSKAKPPSPQVFEDFFSAPGEARECVEIARRVLEESRAGRRFDEMAVLLRSPSAYRAPLEEAFRRAHVPAYFASGIPSPDPSGRALLALLRCAEEGLSARRFSEYLSLGQVPQASPSGAPPPAAPSEERFVRGETGDSLLPSDDKTPAAPPVDEDAEAVDADAPVSAGRLRSPRRWEGLIIEASVIGGTERWRRRLEGLQKLKEKERASPTISEAGQQRVERDLADLKALTGFGLPLLDELAAAPKSAPWGEWLEWLTALATRALKYPRRVLAVLHELSPMSVVGPVTLREVRAVLTPRLSELTEAPQTRRYGHVFIAPVDGARGLSFDVVFVPGLAERIFPQKLREDPLLPDSTRRSLDPELEVDHHRIARERLALQLAVGAATRRAVLSFPRIDAEHARPRVPSFYALEAARAVEGTLPGYEELQRRAEASGRVRLAWPAPEEPARAIDWMEFDLAMIARIFATTGPVKGRARYLVETNAHLARALRARYARWTSSAFTFADGLVKPGVPAREAMLHQVFPARPFSPTALEQYAACPYRFFLSAIHRLSPLEIPGEIEELGPLEKGSMAHEVQFRVLSRLRDEGVEVNEQTLETAFARLDAEMDEVALAYRDEFVPAIDRVWKDGVEMLRADLREWLRRVAAEGEWKPWRFELSFGLANRDQQDPASSPTPVKLEHGLQLRGSIDLVEKSGKGTLRATDYKTGRARAKSGNIVGGGRHLQPLLYGLVLERLFAEQPVESGRLWYCTQAGGFTDVPTPLTANTREAIGTVIRTIRSALEEGFFPAAPAEGECTWCDFRAVCGPEEERRLMRTLKGARAELKPLKDLRKMP